MKEYSKGIYVKFKPEEVEILHDRMKEAGVQNMSAYIRKMAINGYVIIPEWPDLNRVISLHARISNNLNQYAKADCEKDYDVESTIKYDDWEHRVFERILTARPPRNGLYVLPFAIKEMMEW